MAHYAFLNENNVVTEVITGKDETELLDGLSPEEWYGNFRGQKCIRTSYNGTIRKNYAEVGGTYDPERDAFIPIKPFGSWILNEDTCKWEPPLQHPADGKAYVWDESTTNWVEVPEN